MGLTIHYDLTLKDKGATAEAARNTVEKMRQLALDLPFTAVGDVREFAGDAADPDKRDREDEFRWLLIQAGTYIKAPWNGRCSWAVRAEHVIAFEVEVGDGCEPLNLGLVQFPATVDREYKEEDDQRFWTTTTTGATTTWGFDYDKWSRKTRSRRPYRHYSEAETRAVPVRRPGWTWGSFCKTQYASDPACGGVPNFLRCHIAAIALLEKVGRLPGVKVVIQDEGDYGPHLSCPDWREADAEGRKRKYVRSPGKKSPKLLAAEVVTWNEGIAAMFGGLADTLGGAGVTVDAPIQAFQNFEQLEFKGRKANDVGPFLQALAQMGGKP